MMIVQSVLGASLLCRGPFSMHFKSTGNIVFSPSPGSRAVAELGRDLSKGRCVFYDRPMRNNELYNFVLNDGKPVANILSTYYPFFRN